MSSPNDDTILLPRRTVNPGGLDGDTVLPKQNASGIHVAGDVIDNRYTVIREIGRGGMGVVYEVEDRITTARFAIKRLLPTSAANEQIVRAFVKEGTAAETFSATSGHFVTTKSIGMDTYGYYSVMELITVPTLRQVLTLSGRVEPATAIPILLQLASALSALHGAGLIHRDLKPENIFVADASKNPSVKLVDFGLTREITAHTVTGLAGAGSMRYMAPEIFRDEPTTYASDVFAFGAIAYEILTGEPPVGMAKPIREVVPDIDSRWATVITTCLSADMGSRPTATTMLGRVTNFRYEEPVSYAAAATSEPEFVGNDKTVDAVATSLILDVQDGSVVEVNGRSLAPPYRFSMLADLGTKTVIDVQVSWQNFSVFHGQVTLKAGQNQRLRMERVVRLEGTLPAWCSARSALGKSMLPLTGFANELAYIELLHDNRVFERINVSGLSGEVEVANDYSFVHLTCDLPDVIRVFTDRDEILNLPCSYPIATKGETVCFRFASDGLEDFEQAFSFVPGDIWLHPLLGNNILANEVTEKWSPYLFPVLNLKRHSDTLSPETVLCSSNTIYLFGMLPAWCTARTAQGPLKLPHIGLAGELDFVELLYNNRVFERIDVSGLCGAVDVTGSYSLVDLSCDFPDTVRVFTDRDEILKFPCSYPIITTRETVNFRFTCDGLADFVQVFSLKAGDFWLHPLLGNKVLTDEITEAWSEYLFPTLNLKLHSDGIDTHKVKLPSNTISLHGMLPAWCTTSTAQGTLLFPHIGLVRDLVYVEFIHNNRVFDRIELSGLSGSVDVTTNYALVQIESGLPEIVSVYDEQGQLLTFPHHVPIPTASQRNYFEFRVPGLSSIRCAYDLTHDRVDFVPQEIIGRLDDSLQRDWWQVCCPELKTCLDNMCSIPGGRFERRGDRSSNEQRAHTVHLSPFRLSVTPVTVRMWMEYCSATGLEMPKAPRWGWLGDHPIVNVSWNDIMGADGNGGFCAWVSKVAGFPVTLPTEAQWEYACRGGRYGLDYPWGDKYDDEKVWSSANSKRHSTAPVVRVSNTFQSEFGLTDMVGNVWEWCFDNYLDKYEVPTRTQTFQRHRSVRARGINGFLGKMVEEVFEEHVIACLEVTDPEGPSSGELRCVRGASWLDRNPDDFRCAIRLGNPPDFWNDFIGFRLAAGPG